MVAKIEQIPALTDKEKVKRDFLLYFLYQNLPLFSFIFKIKMLMCKAGVRFCLKPCEFAKSKAEKLNGN